jgi:hypothetical protein
LAVALLMPLALSRCGHAGFPKGSEPTVKMTDLTLPLEDGPARVELEISNPNDWPMTLVRLSLSMGGDFQGSNLPIYDTVHREIPPHASESLEVELLVERLDRYRRRGPEVPAGIPPEPRTGEPRVPDEARMRVVELIGRLYFNTPQGRLTRQVHEKREL